MKKSIKIALLVVLGILSTLSFAAGNANKKILGYSFQQCQSQDGMNYCNSKNLADVKTIINAANSSQPNFDNGKKLIQYFYHNSDGIKVTDTLVVDDNKKTINIFPKYAYFSQGDNKSVSPRIETLPNSNWFCLYQTGATFNEGDDGGQVVSYTPADADDNLLSCSAFQKGRFMGVVSIEGGFDNTATYDGIPTFFP